MRPEANDLLMGGFGSMLFDIAPNLNATYSTGSASVLGLLMYCAAIEYERGAEVRAKENDMFRTIFRDATGHLSGDVQNRVSAAGQGVDEVLTISALNASNDALRELLIELHAYVEEMSEAWARDVEHAILKALNESAKMRAIALPAL
ncbi:hypothetical protein [Pyruvatibacter sp.]|uniref:hypothetical protein n=1 Tax=Pyruvatibacter sp. TaxID=1981328 RepID=UPI0032EEC929